MKLPNTTTRLSKTAATMLKRKDESMNNKTTSKLIRSTILGKAKFAVVAAATALSLAVVDADAQNVNIQNPNAIAGQVSWSSSANNWVFTAGNNSIIEFGAFNIYHGGSVQFIQPGANSAVLNRIIGADPSTINGGLSSNGRLFFVNPAGITFGANAVLNVGQIYAAAGSISNSDFLGGNYRFTNLDGTVKNLGTINASSGVALMGQHVVNQGQIYAPGGFITLAAADKVILAPEGSGIIIQIDRTTSSGTSQAGIKNTGVLNATGGHVTAATGDLYSLAMDISGTIVAKDIHLQGGDDGIVKVSGNLNANGSSNGSNMGGKIVVEGEKVWLANGARLNATGANGGGEILVGGDFQGKNNSIRNAWRTHVDSNVVLNASATQAGHGGKIIIWSDNFTNFFGTIKAKGAGYKGRGGFAEVSGKQTLGFRGAVNLKGSGGGRQGILLLDPSDITISDAADNNNIFAVDTFTSNGAASNLDIVTLNAALANASVIITTTGSPDTLLETGNITWNTGTAIAGLNASSLTLNAEDSVIFTNINFGTWTGDFIVNAGLDIVQDGNIIITTALDRSAFGGNITLNAGGAVGEIQINAAISTGGGNLLIDATSTILGGNFTISTGGGNIEFNTGTLNADAVGNNRALILDAGAAGNIVFNGAIGNDEAFLSFTINNANDVTFASTYNGGALTQTDGTGTTTFGGAINVTGSVFITAGSLALNDTISGGGVVDLTADDAAGTFVIGAGADITSDANVVLAGSTNGITTSGNITTSGGTVTFSAAAGGVDLNGNILIDTTNGGGTPEGGGITFIGDLNANTNQTLGLTAGTAGNILFENSVGNTGVLGAITIFNANGVTFSSTVIANDLVTTGNGYFVSMTGTGNTFTENVDFLNTGDVTLGDATADTFAFNGGLDFANNAASNVASTISVAGDANFGTGGVNLDGGSNITVAGTLTLGSITGNVNTLDLIVEGLELTDAISGVTTLHILGANNSESMAFGTDVGGFAADIELLDAEMAFLQGGGVETLELGDAAWTGNVAFAAGATNAFGVTIEQQNAGGGSIFLGTFGAGVGGVTFSGAVDITGSGATTQIAGVNTAASWFINDALELTASASLISDTAGIEIANTGFAIYGTAADFDLTLQALAGESVTITADGFGDNGAADFEIRNLTIQDDTGNGDITANLSMSGDIAGALVVDADNALNLNTNGGTFTAGTMRFDDDMDLDAATILVATVADITFDGTIDGGFDLDANGATGVIFNDTVGGVAALNTLTVTGDATVAANISATNAIDFNNNVSLIGASTMTSAAADITYDGLVDGAFDLAANGATGVIFNDTVGGVAALNTLTVTGATTVAGVDVTATNAIDFNSNVTLTTGAVNMTSTAADITYDGLVDGAFDLAANGATGVIFNDTVGGVAALNTLTVTGDATVAANISATNAIDFNNNVSLIGASTMTSTAADITYDGLVDGAFDLAANGATGVIFNDTVGGVAALNTLTVTGDATVAANISATNAIDFNNNVSLIGASTMTSAAADITYDGLVDGAFDLAANGATGVIFNDTVGGVAALNTLTVTGDATVAANISATNAIDFNNNVSLIGASTMTSAAADITYDGLVDGAFDLAANGATGVIFNDTVGGVAALNTLTVTGATTVAGVDVTATNAIDFNSNVTLTTGAVNMTSTAADITYDGLVDGAFDLAANGATGVIFNDTVGGVAALNTLTVTGATTVAGVDVTATNAIDFNSNVTLTTGAVNMTSTAADITYDGLVDGAFDLAANGATGVIFNDTVGGVAALNTLTVTGDATVAANISATNAIDFNNNVSLIGASTMTSTAADITYDGLVDGAFDLAANGATGVIFNDTVGGVAALNTLTVTGDATVAANISATNAIDFNNNVSLIGASTMTSAAADITYDGLVDGAFDLAANGATGVIFNDTVGGVAALNTLTVTGDATVAANISATNAIDFNNNVSS